MIAKISLKFFLEYSIQLYVTESKLTPMQYVTQYKLYYSVHRIKTVLL